MGMTMAAMMAAAALQASGTAATPQAVVAQAFGNTLLSTYPDGRTAKLWLNADGAYTGQGRRKDATGGTWTISKARLCMKQRKPFFYPFSWCTPLPTGGAFADGWRAKAPTGEAITVSLVKGRP